MSEKKSKNGGKAVHVKLGKQSPTPKPVVNQQNSNTNSDKKK
jgi:hypothetical protein